MNENTFVKGQNSENKGETSVFGSCLIVQGKDEVFDHERELDFAIPHSDFQATYGALGKEMNFFTLSVSCINEGGRFISSVRCNSEGPGFSFLWS